MEKGCMMKEGGGGKKCIENTDGTKNKKKLRGLYIP
jgi:hypothetical protein